MRFSHTDQHIFAEQKEILATTFEQKIRQLPEEQLLTLQYWIKTYINLELEQTMNY